MITPDEARARFVKTPKVNEAVKEIEAQIILRWSPNKEIMIGCDVGDYFRNEIEEEIRACLEKHKWVGRWDWTKRTGKEERIIFVKEKQ